MTYMEQVKKLRESGKGQRLTATPWDPKPGEVLMGEVVRVNVIHSEKRQKDYDKLTLKTDTGVFETIIRKGILELADPAVVKGDIAILTYNGLVPIGKEGRSMHDTTVEVFSMDKQNTF